MVQLSTLLSSTPALGTSWHNPVSPISILYQLPPAVVILSLLSPVLALIRRDKNLIIILAWTIPLILITEGTRLRYLIPIYPALALAAGFAITILLKNAQIRRYTTACIMLFSITIAFSYIPYMLDFSDRNLMDAAAYVQKIGIEQSALVTFFPHRSSSYSLFALFDYYYNGELEYYKEIDDIFDLNYLPDNIILISSTINLNLSIEKERIFEENYQLKRRFESGYRGVWYPTITSVFKKEGYFVLNFESAEKFILDNKDQIIKTEDLYNKIKPATYRDDKGTYTSILQHPSDQGATYLRYPNILLPYYTILKGGIAMSQEVWDPDKGDGVIFNILIETENKTEKVFSKYIDPKNNLEDRQIIDFSIDLSEYGNNTVSIIFVTEAGMNSNYDSAHWINPRFEYIR
jgi:hypothetical protein